MNMRSEQNRTTRVLAGVCIALVATIAFEWHRAVDANVDEDTSPLPIVPSSSQLPKFRARPLSDFDEVLARPLFYENRRLPEAPIETRPESAPLEPLRLTLEGVAIASGARIALLRDERAKEKIRLAEGMSHNGWVLESVESSGAEFRRGVDVTRLELATSDDQTRRRIRRR